MATKIKALQQWCRRMTDGYRDVDVKDFTVSWRNGLAFCAIIHRFRPDLIDYDSLSKENVYENNHLAFTVAENELDIPAFLEAADMVALKTPDKLSVITYVSQYYNMLNSLPQLGGPGVREKTAPAAHVGTKRHQKPEPLSEPEPKKQPPTTQAGGKSADDKSKVKTLGDTCTICKNKVYLLERHVEDGKLYHRSCFRHSDLSPTNKVYTRSPFLSPSLHGKDGGNTPTSKSSSSTCFPSDKTKETVGRMYGRDDKLGTKWASDKSERDDKHKKPDAQKHIFSDKNKNEGKHDGGKGSYFKGEHHPSDPKSSTKLEAQNYALDSKKASSTPTFAHTFEKDSMDFLSTGKDEKVDKTPKRQLPLIFQAAETSDIGVTDKTKNIPDTKISLPSKNKSDTSHVSVSSGIRDENHLKTDKTVGDAKNSSTTGTKTAVDKPVSESAASQKTTMPVAKPRNLSKKTFEEKMDTSETHQARDKSPAFPRATPRISLSHAETSKQSAPRKPATPPALRKARAKSPARDLSPESPRPPPLPSSAPPPLPSIAPNASSGLLTPHHKVASSHLVQKTTQGKSSSKDSASSSSSSKELQSNTSRAYQLSSGNSKVKTTSSSTVPPRPSSVVSISNSKNPTSSSTSVPSTFTSVTTFSLASSKGHEEPMDVDTAIDKARSQYGEEPVAVMVLPSDKTQQDKTVLTGLLQSLAGVRNASSTPSTPTTSAGSHVSKKPDKFHAPALEPESASNSTDKSHSGYHPTSESKKASDSARKSDFITPTSDSTSTHSSKSVSSSSGITSSKVYDSHHQNKKSDQKVVPELSLNERGKGDNVFPRFDHTGKSQQASGTSGDRSGGDKNTDTTKSKILPRSCESDGNTKIADKKLSETVTSTRNFDSKKLDEPRRPKSAILPGFELKFNGKSAEVNGKAADAVPEWKKYLEEPRITITNKSQADLSHGLSAEAAGKRDRAKSAADVFSVKSLSPTRQKATTPDTSQPPAFTQVKLRESGMSSLERKERSMSTGFVFGSSSSDAKSEWQVEAERRMAALRDTGFVDPELKKSSSGSTSPADDDTSPREAAGTPQKAKTGKDYKTEVASPASIQAPPAEQVKAQSEKAKFTSNQKGSDKPEMVKVTLNPKGILKSEKTKSEEKASETPPPQKPERNVYLRAKESEPVVSAAAPSSPRPVESLPLSLPKEQEVVVAPPRKKIGVGNAEGDHTKSPPPRPTSPPHRQERKKVSVDMTFDFNSSNSVELPQTDKTQSPVKLTPPRPPPPVRPTAPKTTNMSPGRISAIELQHQLLDIDSKLSALELRGRELEESIRSVAAEEEDDKMMEWFQLVTEKNELVRKETDLVYMSKEQDLEDEQSQLESQLQYLLSIEDNDKSFEEKEEEEYLIQRKLNIVNQRNSIVETIDENRIRYEEEDRDIAEVLGKKGFLKDGVTPPSKKKGKSKKEKKVGSSMFYA